MHKAHATIIAPALGVAAVTGTFAALETTSVGAQAAPWSDAFGLRLQHVGHAHAWAAVELEGDESSFATRYLDEEGRPLAGLLASRPREVGLLRRELAGLAREEAA